MNGGRAGVGEELVRAWLPVSLVHQVHSGAH